MRKLLHNLVLLSALLTGSAVAADDLYRYHVEVILFSQLEPQSLLSEKWPALNAPLDIPEDAIQLTSTDPDKDITLPDYMTLLPKQDWLLKAPQYGLSRNNHYQVLLHLAWDQTFDRYHDTKPLYIQTDALSGLLHITMRHYFEVQTNFIYQLPVDALGQYVDQEKYLGQNIKDGIASFQIMQSRRMKSRELNYLDNPIIGMLIEFKPIKMPKPTET